MMNKKPKREVDSLGIERSSIVSRKTPNGTILFALAMKSSFHIDSFLEDVHLGSCRLTPVSTKLVSKRLRVGLFPIFFMTDLKANYNESISKAKPTASERIMT